MPTILILEEDHETERNADPIPLVVAEFGGSSTYLTDTDEEFGDESGQNSIVNKQSDKEGFQSEHLGDSRQYWRDIILGVNDGIKALWLIDDFSSHSFFSFLCRFGVHLFACGWCHRSQSLQQGYFVDRDRWDNCWSHIYVGRRIHCYQDSRRSL